MSETTSWKSAAQQHTPRLRLVLGLTMGYLVAEIIGGLVTGSLALLADAAHMFTDVLSLLLALFAIWLARKPATPKCTYGYYRAEILGALLNGMLLLSMAGYILSEAWKRFLEPPPIQSSLMLFIATGGLAVNIISVWLLHRVSGQSLNIRGAYLEVLSDTLGSFGVLIAALIIQFTGWSIVDPLVSVGIGLFLLPRTWGLIREAVGILLEGTPSHIRLMDIQEHIASITGVLRVHDLHIWTLTSGMHAMSAHIRITLETASDTVLRQITTRVKEDYQIAHTTLQLETTKLPQCEDLPI